MFINNKIASAETVHLVLEELKKRHVRHTAKKSVFRIEVHAKPSDSKVELSSRVFGVPLDTVRVSLLECCEGHFYIPSIVSDLIVALKPYVSAEGIFRKVGSAQRQKDIKGSIDKSGCMPDTAMPPVDVAGLLKSYLREIPDALIRTDVCDTLYKCKLLSVADMLETIQLSILLLPVRHIHLLHILLEFLNFVSRHHTQNRMDTNNLAIVMAPSIFSPTSVKSEARCGHFIKILEMMIEKSSTIGKIPACIWNKLTNAPKSDPSRTGNIPEIDKKTQKKKRRSSFTSVIAAGFRKIRRASYGDPPEAAPVCQNQLNTNTKPLGNIANLTPPKRSVSNAKTEPVIANKLPPRLPLSSTPIVISKKRKMDTNAPLGFSNRIRQNVINSMPSNSLITPTPSKRLRTLTAANINRATSDIENEQPSTSQETPADRSKDDLLCINKKLMRDVAFLEKRLNRLENFVAYQICGDTPANTVQDAYEKTLEEAAMIDTSSSQQLTDRLSREMKLRQEKSRPKVIRSPSARKIGTIRRRSRDSWSGLEYKQTYTKTDNL